MLDAQELDILSKIQIATRGATEKLAYKTGLLPAPAVHLVHAGQYDGYIGCRPFHRGEDARVAIARMGQLAGAFHATSMMIVWEAGDLARAIGVGDQMAEAEI